MIVVGVDVVIMTSMYSHKLPSSTKLAGVDSVLFECKSILGVDEIA
jgi:hypothetical protein